MKYFLYTRCGSLLKLSIFLVPFLGLAVPSQAQDKVQVFAGYSYLRASVQAGQSLPVVACSPISCSPISQNASLNGWEFSGEYKLLPFVGVLADFAGDYGTLDGASARIHTFLFGPQIALPGKISPFVHALFGVARESQGALAGGAFYSLGSDTSAAIAIGGGIDVKLIPFIAVRLVQVDYLRTQLHGATQNQPRISAGLVLHF